MSQMTFGVKTTDHVETSEGGDYIHRFNKAGEYRLRFLEEYDQWTVYKEHFSADKSTSYPCTGDRRECPGCTSPSEKEAKPSTKYLVNAVLRQGDQEGYAHLWKLPYASLVDSFKRYMGKSGGTLTDRDFTVTRNDGDRVSYDIDREDKEPFDISKFSLQDHQAALSQEYAEAWDPEARAAKQERLDKSKAKSDDAKKAEPEPEPETEEEEVPDALLSKEERAAKAKTKVGLAKDPEPEPEEEVTLTPSAIRSMPAAKLVKLYKDAGFEDELDAMNGAKPEDLAEKLIELLS